VLIVPGAGQRERRRAFSAAAAGGALRAAKTTPLLTMSEIMEAMKRAAKEEYRAPG
jgi:flavin-binding protein dodecin